MEAGRVVVILPFGSLSLCARQGDEEGVAVRRQGDSFGVSKVERIRRKGDHLDKGSSGDPIRDEER